MNTLNYILFAFILLGVSQKVNSETLESETNAIQRVRIDFHTPSGFTRHLLLGFTPDNAASDGFDYGYDARNFDQFPNDMFWNINGEDYVIQGVGEFHESKCYPLSMFLSNSGTIGISLNSLENFETEIDVFVYDAVLGTFNSINSQNYSSVLASGNYLDRYYITFTNNINQINMPNNALSVNKNYFENTFINYLSQSKELLIDSNEEFIIKDVTFYNLNSQEVHKLNIYTDRIKIPLQFVSSNSIIVKITSNSGAFHFKQIVVH